MKKLFLMIAAVAALVCSCQKVEDEKQVSGNGGYSFDFTIAPGGFENTKGDATVGWTVGEKVFVFFKPDGGTLISDGYVAFIYKEDGSWGSVSTLSDGSLGEAGKMAAVYVPYLAAGVDPVFDGDKWTIDGGDVYYACASGDGYTVKDGTVYGTLAMKIPDGYVQFAVDPAAAAAGDKLACNYVDAYSCVTLMPDLSFSSEAVADKKMTGHEDNGKIYFWGKMNGATAADCKWVLTTRKGEATMKVSASAVAKNTSYSLTSMPVIAGIQLWEDGPCWAECNLGATRPEEYGDYFAWGETTGYQPEGSAFTHAFNWNSYCGSESFIEWSTVPYDATTKVLKPAYDAAAAADPDWRTPTKEEFKALRNNCYLEWTDDYNSTGVKGVIAYKVKDAGDKGVFGGKTGYATSDTHIFFPAAGYGDSALYRSEGIYGLYLSSTLYSDNTEHAYILSFQSGSVNAQANSVRYYGCTVRPVTDVTESL